MNMFFLNARGAGFPVPHRAWRTVTTALAVAAVTLMHSSCGAPRMMLDPTGVSVIRTYQLNSTVINPEPAWNPETYMIVVRSLGGFGLLQEGQGRQEYFESRESRPTFYPVWINREQFVFGPQHNVSSIADGRVVPSTDGLTLVAVNDTGLKTTVENTAFSTVGFRPRVGAATVYAQVEDKMVVFDRNGKRSDAGEGFYPEPQGNGPGVCWQETPVIEADRWTGKAPRGRLFIRWSPGQITEIPGGCEARWTPNGGVVCTVLRGDPGAAQWWSTGTDVMYVAPRAATPRLIAKDARNPVPHPSEPVVAVSDSANGVRLVSLRDPQAKERLLSATGSEPLWSHDGLRLLTVEPRGGEQPAVMVIYVLKITPTSL